MAEATTLKQLVSDLEREREVVASKLSAAEAALEVRLLPVRPRSRCARRSLRTFPVVSLRPSSLAHNLDTPRCLSTSTDAPLNSTPTFASIVRNDPQFDPTGAVADALEEDLEKSAATMAAIEVRLLPIRPRSRGERRSLRTFPVVTLHPRFPFNV